MSELKLYCRLGGVYRKLDITGLVPLHPLLVVEVNIHTQRADNTQLQHRNQVGIYTYIHAVFQSRAFNLCIEEDRRKGNGRGFCAGGGGGEEFIKFLPALAILPRTIFKNRFNSSFSFQSSWSNSSYNSNCPV